MCNLCSFNSIKKRAKKDGMKVTTIPTDFPLGGTEVYVHPKEIKIPDHPDKEKYFVAWFMEIPNHHVD